jgi:hypothetical protein
MESFALALVTDRLQSPSSNRKSPAIRAESSEANESPSQLLAHKPASIPASF